LEIRNFDDLLRAACAESQRQRMLFVFVKSVAQADDSPAQLEAFERGQGGALMPCMSVDKEPESLADFAQLVADAKEFSDEWDMVLVACMGGRDGKLPAREQTDAALDEMLSRVEQGADLSRYLCFNRNAEPVHFAPTA
jgi:hypothetical protein